MVYTPRAPLRWHLIAPLIFIVSGSLMIFGINLFTGPQRIEYREVIGDLKGYVLRPEQNISISTREGRTTDSVPVTRQHPHLSMAKKIYPRVCCFVLTDPNLLNKTVFSRDTWTRRCDRSFFMSSIENKTFPTIGLGNDTQGRNRLIAKARKSWIYMYTHHLNDCEYFVKADPDTYIIVENLKDYLSNFNPEDSQHFGHIYNPPEKTWSYLAGGPGEVLSRQALKHLVEKAFRGKEPYFKVCQKETGGEDNVIGKCLSLIQSQAIDTRDSKGRQRFMVFGVSSLILGRVPKWYVDLHQGMGKLSTGLQCCSDFPIGFHYVRKEQLKVLDYYLYGVKKKFDLGISPFSNDTKEERLNTY